MTIEPYQQAHLEETVTVWFESHRAALSFLRAQYSLEQFRSFFISRVLPKAEIWLAKEHGRILGFLVMKGNYLDHLYVLPSAQRKGVGLSLLTKAKEISPEGITLHSFQKNTMAKSFYEKHGFKAVRFGVSLSEQEPDIEFSWKPN